MLNITLHSNQSVVVYNGAWTGDSLALDGVVGPRMRPIGNVHRLRRAGLRHRHGRLWNARLCAIAVAADSSLTMKGLTVNDATMTFSENFGSTLTLGGNSQIVHGSTLTATPYRGYSAYTVNGTMAIDGSSTVNMDYVAVNGQNVPSDG